MVWLLSVCASRLMLIVIIDVGGLLSRFFSVFIVVFLVGCFVLWFGWWWCWIGVLWFLWL